MNLIDDPTPGSNTPDFSVAEIAGTVKRLIEGELGWVRVRGEVGRVVLARSGHLYFDLKDGRNVLSCMTWKGQIAGIGVMPEEGMEVVAEGPLTAGGFQSKFSMNVQSAAAAGRVEQPSQNVGIVLDGPAITSIALMLPTLNSSLSDLEATLADSRPNSLDGIQNKERLTELAADIRSSFDELAESLGDEKVEEKGGSALRRLGKVLNDWAIKNKDDFVDVACRTPILAASVGLLYLVGANMLVGTAIAGALIGGPRVLSSTKEFLK